MGEHVIENSLTGMYSNIRTDLKRNQKMYATTMNHVISSPWGSSFIVSGDEDSPNRVIHYTIKPKHTIPKQTYKYRSNHIIVTNGIAKVNMGDDSIILGKNGHLFISNNIEYSVSNLDKKEGVVEFFELQNGIKNEEGNYDLSEFA